MRRQVPSPATVKTSIRFVDSSKSKYSEPVTFLLMMEETMRPRQPTVLVMSRAAYISLDTAALVTSPRCIVWPHLSAGHRVLV